MATQSGSGTIQHFCLNNLQCISAQVPTAFCRVNGKVKTLQIRDTIIKTSSSSLQEALQMDVLNRAYITALDKLVLDGVYFCTHDDWTMFFRALAQGLKITTMVLGCLTVWCTSNPLPMVSELMQSEVKRLVLLRKCHLKRFTSGSAAQGSLEELRVELCHQPRGRDSFDVLVKTMLPNMPELRVLCITLSDSVISSRGLTVNINAKTKQRFLQLVDENAILTDIQVIVEGGGDVEVFSQEEIQWLQGRAIRNQRLLRFVTNPSSLSEKELLMLMLQLENCPTGRLQLARALPKAYFPVNE